MSQRFLSTQIPSYILVGADAVWIVPYYPLLAIVTKTDLSVACEVWVRKN
jgi:hypothetical protein